MPTAISLFSGCGGDTLGLTNAGYEVIAFSEFNKAAIQTHERNFPNSTLMRGPAGVTDITKIPDTVFHSYAEKADVLFAGFPCQGFSRAGKKKASDPRNQLFQQFVRATRLIRPKMIIGENVTGLRTMKSGPNPDDPMMLDIITQAFRDIGYTLTHQLVEIVQFGVPQKRKRILILGWPIAERSHPTPEPASLWASITTAGAAKPLPIQRTFISNSMEGAYRLDPTKIPEGFEDYALAVDQDAEPSGTPHPFVVLKADASLLSCSKRDSPIHSEVIDLDSPSKTIICTYDHQPRLLVGLRKPDGTSYVRILLPDELKQIQGFPANFVLLGNKKEQVTQVGNAVPPPLIECVGNVLKNYI
jgi:DNA (cytosine-5)-methyltransferase 1